MQSVNSAPVIPAFCCGDGTTQLQRLQSAEPCVRGEPWLQSDIPLLIQHHTELNAPIGAIQGSSEQACDFL